MVSRFVLPIRLPAESLKQNLIKKADQQEKSSFWSCTRITATPCGLQHSKEDSEVQKLMQVTINFGSEDPSDLSHASEKKLCGIVIEILSNDKTASLSIEDMQRNKHG